MKKLLSIFLVLVITVSMIPVCVPVHAVETTSDGFEYDIANGEAVITRYIGSAADIVIPSEIDGYPVTKIADWTFRTYNKALESVIIPEGVSSIGHGAFMLKRSLKAYRFPKAFQVLKAKLFPVARLLKVYLFPMVLKSSKTTPSAHAQVLRT